MREKREATYEDDGRSLFARQSKRVAHELGTVTDEHLHELRCGELQEAGVRLRGAGTGEQGLAGTRRTVEQHACAVSRPSAPRQ